jgi:hypothetical protein
MYECNRKMILPAGEIYMWHLPFGLVWRVASPRKTRCACANTGHTGWFMIAPASGWVGALVTKREDLRLVPRRRIPE